MFKSRLFHSVPNHLLSLESAEDFARFYDTVHIDVFRYIYAFVNRHRQEAEDLTAEAFIRAWKARQRFQGSPDAAKGWILVIARNVVIDHHRRERQQRIVDFPINAVAESSSIASGEALDQAAEMTSLLQKLPVDQREIMVLRYCLDWPVTAIAKHLGKRENTISVTIRRCLQRLRNAYEQNGKEQYQ